MAKTPDIDLREDYGRNYIINGDMRISQRGTSFPAIGNNAYSLDRFKYLNSSNAVHTITQDTDVPTLTESGYLFQKSIRLNLTNPDDAVSSTDYCFISQIIEGYNFASLAQKPFTLSFWVKAATTGIRSVSFKNSGVDASYVAEYTINAANTWEKKTIQVSASPSAGSWDYTTGTGLRIQWALVSGSNLTTSTLNSWQAGNYWASTNQVNGVATGSADFRLTGIMLNEGTEALPFRTAGKTLADEFRLCQRYYEKSYHFDVNPGTSTATNLVGGYWNQSTNQTGYLGQRANFMTTKRVNNPGITLYDPVGNINKVGGHQTSGALVTNLSGYTNDAGSNSFVVYFSSAPSICGIEFHYVAESEL